MEKITDKIIGSWELISWKYKDDTGVETDYFGENPIGILMYDKNGKMNAQLMKSNRTNFVSQSFNGGTQEEMAKAFDGYFCYFGDFYEREPGEIVHVVKGSLFPNWTGINTVRYGKLEDNILSLYTQPIISNEKEVIYYINWRRIG
jgi:hypothetical protein